MQFVPFSLANVLKDAVNRGSNALYKRPWHYNRKDFLNASEAGVCIRQLWYEKNARSLYPGAEKGSGSQKRGTVIEDYIQNALMSSVNGLSDRSVILKDDLRCALRQTFGERLSGNPDFIYLPQGRGSFSAAYVGEIKSVTDERFKRVASDGPFPENWKQLVVNVALAVKNLAVGDAVYRGLLIYINCNDYDRMIEFETPIIGFSESGGILEDMERRAERLFNAREPEQLPPEGVLEKDFNCAFCPYTSDCKKPEMATPVNVEIHPEILDEYTATGAEVAEGKERLEYLRSLIIEKFGYRRYGKIDRSPYTVTYAERERKGGLDVEKMAQDGISCKAYVKSSTFYDVLTVKKREEDAG